MNYTRLRAAVSLLLCLSTSGLALAAGKSNAFVDVLEAPAQITPLALNAPLLSLAKVDGRRLVGVGQRGHILLSEDGGGTWRQQALPVSADLVAVQFPTSSRGWAVGHDGVMLTSDDAGRTWRRVMDGRTLAERLVEAYEKRLQAGDPSVARALDDARRMVGEGPVRPFLSVYFRNPKEGWVLGQFNLLLHTSDGGVSWEPWLERTENPDAYSLHAMREVGGALYIVGELGLVLRYDPAAGVFRRIQTPFTGSWFGLTGSQRCVVAFGLRGAVGRSCDGGGWTRVDSGTQAAVNGGLVTDDGQLVLVTQQGQVLTGALDAEALKPLPPVPGQRGLYDAVQVDQDWIVVAGERGATRVRLPVRFRP